MQLLKERFHHILEGTTRNILGVGRNQADTDLVTVAMVRLDQLFVQNQQH
jgi:hypothetical protein